MFPVNALPKHNPLSIGSKALLLANEPYRQCNGKHKPYYLSVGRIIDRITGTFGFETQSVTNTVTRRETIVGESF